jgi:hypothetical protein
LYELRLVLFTDLILITFLDLLEDSTAEVICGGGSYWRRPSNSTRVKLDFDQKNKSDVAVTTKGLAWKGGVFAVTNDNEVSQLNSIGYFRG